LIEPEKVFLKIGFFGFGGPAAHIGMIEDEIVSRRKWVTKEKLIDLISIAKIIPGPNSTEVVFFIGYIKGGLKGLVIAGISFMFPAVLITLGFAIVYVKFGSLPNLQWILLGVKPTVIAIIGTALIKLSKSSLKKE
jgi:chromate transporter